MADIKECIEQLLAIDGAKYVALVDSASGMVLGSANSGDSGFDIELAAAGNSQVVKAKLETMKSVGLEEEIEDILITIETQYHIIRPIANEKGLFFYLNLSKDKANLALARRKMHNVEQDLSL